MLDIEDEVECGEGGCTLVAGVRSRAGCGDGEAAETYEGMRI